MINSKLVLIGNRPHFQGQSVEALSRLGTFTSGGGTLLGHLGDLLNGLRY